MNKIVSIHALISGKVQGVYYRSATQQQAQQLQLTGWVKNLADGRVELIATGEEVALCHLVDWLWKGPAAAQVVAVDWEFIVCQEFDQFTVMPR